MIDDLASVSPWSPRFIRIYGTAELVDRDGEPGSASIMRITPTVSWSLNLAGDWSPGTGELLAPRRTEHASL